MSSILIATSSYNNLTKKGEESLIRTIDSIKKSIRTLTFHRKEAKVIVSWIDDGSTDNTYEWVQSYTRGDKEFNLLKLYTNQYAGFGRNLSVARFDSDYIALFDSDDEMFENHLILCYDIMQHPIKQGKYLGLAYTKICCSEYVHPDWISGMENVAPINKIIRRNVWDFIEGMPTEKIFALGGGEDVDFIEKISKFFVIGVIPIVTVRYWNYQGNSLDSQLPVLRLPRSQAKEIQSTLYEPVRQQIKIRTQQTQRFIQYLSEKLEYKNQRELLNNVMMR